MKQGTEQAGSKFASEAQKSADASRIDLPEKLTERLNAIAAAAEERVEQAKAEVWKRAREQSGLLIEGFISSLVIPEGQYDLNEDRTALIRRDA